jgi:hypothetical protein
MPGPDARKFFPQAAREGVYQNADRAGVGDAAESMAAAAAAQREWREFGAGKPLAVSTPEQRARRRELSAAFARTVGVEADFDEAVKLARERYVAVTGLGDLIHPAPTFHPHPPPVADVGVLWWGETAWWTPVDRIGLYAYFDDAAGGVSFVGQLDYNDGDLWKGSAGATAVFGLGTDRMPPAGRYVSRPSTDLFGEVIGFTGVSGPFSFGDNWCKCWLHTDQTIRSDTGAIIGNGHAVQELLFLESDGDQRVTPLPGSLFFPPVGFNLDPTHALTITLELKFDLQLEGDSLFRYGNYGGFVAALWRTPQWHIEQA